MQALALFSLLPLALAAPTSTPYSWSVTSWSAGGSRGGSYYDFHISGAEATIPSSTSTYGSQELHVPAFAAYCSGSTGYVGGDDAPFRDCKVEAGDVGVSADLANYDLQTADGVARIAVSLRFEDGATYNFTGHGESIYNQFAAPLQNFTVTPDELVEV